MTERYRTQYALLYTTRLQEAVTDKELSLIHIFDSYSMDLNSFKAQLQARLSEWNDNEEGYTYYIGSEMCIRDSCCTVCR